MARLHSGANWVGQAYVSRFPYKDVVASAVAKILYGELAGPAPPVGCMRARVKMKRTMGLRNSWHFAIMAPENGAVQPVFLQGGA